MSDTKKLNAFDAFLTNCVRDSINGYTAGVKDDAAERWSGRSDYEPRYTCPGCGTSVKSADAGGWCFSCWHDYHFKPKAPEPPPTYEFKAEGQPGQPCPDCEGTGIVTTAWRDHETMRREPCMNCLGRGRV